MKNRISYSDAEYFNTVKEARVAKTHRDARVPTLEQIRHVILTMPAGTEIERRDRALFAFTILTGARDGATASFKLKHVEIAEDELDQDARQVNTKFSKSFTTWFFHVGDEIRQIVIDWVNYLRQKRLWGLDDPLFPATKVVVGSNQRFVTAGLDRKHWSSAGPIRQFSKTPLRPLASPISTRTASGRHLPFLARKSARLRRSTRPGPRTSAMKASSRPFRAMVKSPDIDKPK